jgi:hypothetical protein
MNVCAFRERVMTLQLVRCLDNFEIGIRSITVTVL